MTGGYLRTSEKSRPVPGRGTVLRSASDDILTIEARLDEAHGDVFGRIGDPFLARTERGEFVALKIYDPHPSFQAVFAHEQRMGLLLNHPNIVKIRGHGMFGDRPFAILEYFHAGSLLAWCRSHERIRGPALLSIATQVASAIDFAHSRWVFHETIAPVNVWVGSSPEGRVALGDFGMASAMSDPFWDELPHFALEYLAPESGTWQENNPKPSDIYSFGVLVYELTAGQLVTERRKRTQSVASRINQDLPDIRTYREDVSERLALRLAQTLSRDPRQRPPSAGAVLTGVEDCIAAL